MDYCFSNQDFSLDQKLAQIQQSYLISERACNCSNACTPQAERVRREESRRKKRALRRATEDTNEEQAAKNGKGKEAEKRPEVSVGVEVNEEGLRVGQTKKGTLRQAKQEASSEQVTTKGKAKEGEKGLRQVEAGLRVEAKEERVKGDQYRGKRRTLRQVKGENQAAMKEKEGGKGPGKLDIGEAKEKGAMTDQQRTGSECQEPASEKESAQRGKGKVNRRKMLGDSVVSALKRNGMSRSHPHFRKSFERLFKVSKIFMEVRIMAFSMKTKLHCC